MSCRIVCGYYSVLPQVLPILPLPPSFYQTIPLFFSFFYFSTLFYPFLLFSTLFYSSLSLSLSFFSLSPPPPFLRCLLYSKSSGDNKQWFSDQREHEMSSRERDQKNVALGK